MPNRTAQSHEIIEFIDVKREEVDHETSGNWDWLIAFSRRLADIVDELKKNYPVPEHTCEEEFASDWIPAEYDLPSVNGAYLVVNKNGVRLAAFFRNENVPDGRWTPVTDTCGCCDNFDENITHWMPLPDLPLTPTAWYLKDDATKR